MARSKTSFLALLTGAAVGAVAVALSNKKNRQKAEKSLNNPKQLLDDIFNRGQELVDSIVVEKKAAKKKTTATKKKPKAKAKS